MSFPRFSRGFGFREAMLLTTGCFVLIALGVTGVAFISRNYADQGTRQTETLTGQFLPGLVTLARLQESTNDLTNITLQFALARDEPTMNSQRRAFELSTADVNRSLEQLRLFAHDPQSVSMIADFGADVQRYYAASKKFQTELRSGDFEAAMSILDRQVGPIQREVETRLRALDERYFQQARDASARTTALLRQSDHFGLLSTLVLAGFTILSLALSLAATRFLLAQIEKRDVERLAAQVTLEKRVEERTAALRASEERVRLIVDTASDAIITFDATDVIAAWNAQAEKIFGWTQADSLGRGLTETVIAPGQRDFFRQRIQRFLLSGNGTELRQYIETTGMHRDGHELPLELTISPVRLGPTVLFSAFVRDITERKRAEAELRQVHRQLVDTSRQAGMAEVATGVLHNVGNVLNSVNVSATLVIDQMAHSKTDNLAKIATMLQEHDGQVGDFLANDPKGRRIPGYLIALSADLATEQSTITGELGHLRKNIDHIKDIVAMQQSYAMISGVTEQIPASSIVEDALRMNSSALMRHGLEVIRDYQANPTITVERHKVLQILVNLVRNAKYACDDANRTDKQVTLRIALENDRVRILVIDNGVGIPPENLRRIFAHGFTTRKNGHGFGLHSGALVAKELGGALFAASDGPGTGATFTLEIPLAPPSSA